MKKFALLAAFAVITMPTIAEAVEGFWRWSAVQRILNRDGFIRTMTNCTPSRSAPVNHCTVDFQNHDGVRISVAVRNTLDGNPDYAYRVVCTASCNKFRSW